MRVLPGAILENLKWIESQDFYVESILHTEPFPFPKIFQFIKKIQTWAIYIFVFNNKVTILRFQDPDPFKWKVDPDPQ